MRVPTFDEIIKAFGMYGVCMALRSPEWAAVVAGVVFGAFLVALNPREVDHAQ